MNLSPVKITINDHRKIFAIQQDFNEAFPYLKLEFFKKSNSSGGQPGMKPVEENKTIAECRTRHNNGTIEINPNMTVADLEHYFADVFGITVNVWRKSGKVWLETSVTEGWTLLEQNKQGEALSKAS